MTAGDRIRIKREELQMSQEELARRVGVKSKSSVSKVESAGDDLSTKTIQKYADALGVSPVYLLGWDDDIETDWGTESQNQQSYYMDAETSRIAEEIHHNKELALLFDAARDVAPEDLRTVHALLLSLKRKERFDD